MCIIESSKGQDRHNGHQIEEMQNAYSSALKILKSRNKDIEDKKKTIKDQMSSLIE
jgi:hypothetical protein